MSDILITAIRPDTAAQPRDHIDTDIVAAYAADMAGGAIFPPVVVYQEGDTFWLADGFHRLYAAKGAGAQAINCDVRQGNLRDAILYSVGANADHGYRRTNEDKRLAVLKLLNDPEWSSWNDSEIARHCRVGHAFVSNLRPAPSFHSGKMDYARKVSRGGSTYTMRTGNIGRSPSPPTEEPEPPLPPAAMAQHNADLANGFISSAMQEIERQIAALPSPEEAAQRFPRFHLHVFTANRLDDMADWLTRFAIAWREAKFDHGEGMNVAAE
jgi:ParB-like nuclease domain